MAKGGPRTPPAPARPAPRPKRRLVELSSVFVVAVLAVVWVYRLPDVFAVCSPSKSIYTVDESNPTVQCITVHDSRIASTTGSLVRTWLSVVLTSVRPKFFLLEPGAIIVPGLADSHAHIMEYGLSKQLPLEDATSIEDVVQLVKRYIMAHPDVYNNKSRWIEGMGWDQTKWASSTEFPTAADLDHDPLLRGRHIVLNRVDGHAFWVSAAVLEHITPLPDAVPGGLIVRDAQGRPTGVLVDNAMDLIPRSPLSKQQMHEFFLGTMNDALRYGLTSVHDAATLPDAVAFYKEKAENGELPIRLYLMGYIASMKHSDWANEFTRLVDYGVHARLNLRGVKLFADGALGSWGAALLEPYSDNPATDGILRFDIAELTHLVKALWRDGWQVGIHCIGDRANRVVLDIYEDMIQGTTDVHANVTAWRPRIEHAQIMTTEDIERCGRIGVITSVQPTHATSDMWYAETRLGPKRIKNAYAYQTLLQASRDHVLPIGSDFPVEGINPLLGFYAAVSRLSVTGTSPHGTGGWYPEQKLSRIQALKGMTLDAAYASFAENELGSLVPGKKADFVVLDRDIMTIPVEEILETKVLATIVDGKVAYGAL